MTTPIATLPVAPSAADVEAAVIALQARLRETPPGAHKTRPLNRSTVMLLLRIVRHYQALTQRREE